jgi:hypothetical protein
VKAQRKRFTLDLEPSMQMRLKVVAALKGVSMRQYCLTAIEKELGEDQVIEMPPTEFANTGLGRLISLRDEVFQGRQVAGDSTDLIRQARAERAEAL